jgi:hypothetical protein
MFGRRLSWTAASGLAPTIERNTLRMLDYLSFDLLHLDHPNIPHGLSLSYLRTTFSSLARPESSIDV